MSTNLEESEFTISFVNSFEKFIHNWNESETDPNLELKYSKLSANLSDEILKQVQKVPILEGT